MAEYIKDSIISGKNRDVEYQEDSGIECPTCYNSSKANLMVRAKIDDQLTLECPNCAYLDYKKVGEVNPTDIKGRPLKV